ncbi:MAG TPA: hypothetical protein VGB15_10195, partial [Longimicrobium sp.]
DQDSLLFEATGDISPPIVPPGEFSTANQVFTMVGMAFPRPGVYRFVVNIQGLEPHETHFVVSNAVPDSSLN